VEINLAYINPSPLEYQQLVNLVIHEMAHVFAFSNKHYKYYVDPLGNLLG